MSNDLQGKAIRLILIDHDPIFRLGLKTFLTQFPEMSVLVDVSTVAQALHELKKINNAASAVTSMDLVILAVEDVTAMAPDWNAIALIQTLQSQYPQLPLLLIDSNLSDREILAARELGVKGYFPKGSDPNVLVNAIRQISAGASDWVGVDIPLTRKTRRLSAPVTRQESNRRRLWMEKLRLSANRQMNAEIAELDAQLKNIQLSPFERFFLLGRLRELKVARWLVNQLLPAINGAEKLTFESQKGFSEGKLSSLATQNSTELSWSGSGDLERSPQIYPLDFSSLKSQLFDRVLPKLQSRLENLTDIALEIDILKVEKKQQLLYQILRQFDEMLSNLKSSQLQPDDLREKQEILVLDLWQGTIIEFFGKYSSLLIGKQQIELVPFISQDAALVQSTILNKIPQVSELFSYLLFQTPFTIDNVEYLADRYEALQHAEFLLENLILQVANGVIYPLLNRLADVEKIKQEFYDPRWMTTREIERFRNNLSWRYRWQKYWQEPKSIFESQYVLLVFDERGIRKISSYAPRRDELAKLNGLQQAVTLLLETRDAIAPRIESMMVFLGSGGRYLLMQLGRGIGLIAQGIIQGIGNSLQDLKVRKNREP